MLLEQAALHSNLEGEALPSLLGALFSDAVASPTQSLFGGGMTQPWAERSPRRPAPLLRVHA